MCHSGCWLEIIWTVFFSQHLWFKTSCFKRMCDLIWIQMISLWVGNMFFFWKFCQRLFLSFFSFFSNILLKIDVTSYYPVMFMHTNSLANAIWKFLFYNQQNGHPNQNVSVFKCHCKNSNGHWMPKRLVIIFLKQPI